LLESLQNDSGEAQYWFSDETLGVVESAILAGNADSVLCIGTPSLFESIKSSEQFENHNIFLLDFDDRLSHFYTASEFARYSMLVNYFYTEESKEQFTEFFRRSKNMICICDPPFGAYVSALMQTIDGLKKLFMASKGKAKGCSFKTILFLSLFVGKHVQREHEEFSMVDFKVTYSNHKDFIKPEKSIVRMFTDLPNKTFKLPTELGYKFCEQCERFVCAENRHCFKCQACTSKDGFPYRHCDRCKVCVKAKYEHCQSCGHCHLKDRCIRRKYNNAN